MRNSAEEKMVKDYIKALIQEAEAPQRSASSASVKSSYTAKPQQVSSSDKDVPKEISKATLAGVVAGAGLQTACAATATTGAIASTAVFAPILPIAVPITIVSGGATLISDVVCDVVDDIISDIFDFW